MGKSQRAKSETSWLRRNRASEPWTWPTKSRWFDREFLRPRQCCHLPRIPLVIGTECEWAQNSASKIGQFSAAFCRGIAEFKKKFRTTSPQHFSSKVYKILCFSRSLAGLERRWVPWVDVHVCLEESGMIMRIKNSFSNSIQKKKNFLAAVLSDFSLWWHV